MTERICFTLQLEPAQLDDYVRLHRAVWPSMLRAIERAGRRNYSLFVRDDGLLVGYYEVDDDARTTRALLDDPDTATWEAHARRFFLHLEGRPDQAPPLRRVFTLEEQLRMLPPG